MLRGSRAFSGKIHQPFLAHVVPPLAAVVSRRRPVTKVGTFENKNVHKLLRLWPLGLHRRRLVVRSGTSKGSTISQYGCSTFEALATRPNSKKKKKIKFDIMYSYISSSFQGTVIYYFVVSENSN